MQGLCPTNSKDENRNHILKCKAAYIGRDEISSKSLGISMQTQISGGEQNERIKNNRRNRNKYYVL
jgi:hypothetical protein